jgi:hypothetical protein
MEAVKDEQACFFVKAPAGHTAASRVSCVVVDAQDKQEVQGVQITPYTPEEGDESGVAAESGVEHLKVTYTPTKTGVLSVRVVFDDQAVSGSPFEVFVLDTVSLGGEGKVRVYFTTVTPARKVRSDIEKLEKLFTIKRIHLLPDFEVCSV